MKILIEDNGSEVELEIREYLHFANTVHELGDSDYAISQRGVTKALEDALESKLKKVILLTDTVGTNLITFELNDHLIVSEIDLVIDSGMPIGTTFDIASNSNIEFLENESIYILPNNLDVYDLALTGNIKLTKITEELWIST